MVEEPDKIDEVDPAVSVVFERRPRFVSDGPAYVDEEEGEVIEAGQAVAVSFVPRQQAWIMHYCRANLYSLKWKSLSIMAPPPPPEDDDRDMQPLSDEVLIEVLESIKEPALLYLPGGRIAGVNRAAARLAPLKPVGMTIGELLGRYETRCANGTPLRQGDLPYNRALRGEIVSQGERIEMTLPDGTIYQALVTSTPIIVDGKVVAALSVWRDFNAYIRGLASPPEPPSDPTGGG